MMNCESRRTEVEDEYEKLVFGMNPPRVTVDNTSSRKATLVKVDSPNQQGCLLEVVQVLTDFKLTVKRAYITCDGEWFMDVFHVVDLDGKKISETEVDHIEKSLGARVSSFSALRRSVGVLPATEHTAIELIGRDRPGLLSDIFAVLKDLKCNVVAAQSWTHNSTMALVVYITDEETREPINDADRLARIKHLLRYILKGNRDRRTSQTAISLDATHPERRLHQMMHADHQRHNIDDMGVDEDKSTSNKSKPHVTVEKCMERGYTVVTVRCKDRPNVLFDTVCTLTDMQYIVFHAVVIAEEPEAYQEYYIRHINGCPVSSEEERQRLIHCLEAAIERRTPEGLRLELCCEDRVGLLSDVTRIFRENGLSLIHAEVSTQGSQAVNVFYVMDASGNPVQCHIIDAIRTEIGQTILHVKHNPGSESTQGNGRFFLGKLLRNRSENFLYNLGLTRSCSED